MNLSKYFLCCFFPAALAATDVKVRAQEPSPLEVPPILYLVPGEREEVVLEVRNFKAEPLLASLRVLRAEGVRLDSGAEVIQVRVAPQKTAWVKVPLRVSMLRASRLGTGVPGTEATGAVVSGSENSTEPSLTFELRAGAADGAGKEVGAVLATEHARVAFAKRALPLNGEPWNDPATWLKREPVALLREVVPPAPTDADAPQPDDAARRHGANDLSGRVWMASDDKYLYLAAAVQDDVHRPAAGFPPDMRGAEVGRWQRGDGLWLYFGYNNSYFPIVLTDDNSGPLSWGGGEWQRLAPWDAMVRVRRVEGEAAGTTAPTTWYFLLLTRQLALGSANRLAFNALALDDDQGEREMSLAVAQELPKAPDPSAVMDARTETWPRVVFSPPATTAGR